MPVSKPQDLPAAGGGRWPIAEGGFRSVQWGDMEVGYTTTGPIDCTPVYANLPGGVCQCPHYGYVFKGTLRCRYPGTEWPEEIARSGDVYYFPAGHVLIYDDDTEALELNPASALQTLMGHIQQLADGGPA